MNTIRVAMRRISDLGGQKLRQAYAALELEEGASSEEVRERYARLVRRFHPDSGGKEADPARFEQVHKAYRFILKQTGVDEEEDVQSAERDFGIQHTAPQHRQYLEYGGLGHGTPSSRQRQYYQRYRVSNALENVREFTIEKTIRESQDPGSGELIAINEQRKRRKRQMTGMLDRVVEDMILSSMATGEFKNLKGAGKPLKQDPTNPYIDETQQRINRILRDNGFSPAWIVKENEIRNSVADFRSELRTRLADEFVGRHPNDDEIRSVDSSEVDRVLGDVQKTGGFETKLKTLNKLINDYNLISPSLDRQMMPLRLEREVERAKTEVFGDQTAASSFIYEALDRQNQRRKKREQSRQSEGKIVRLLSDWFHSRSQ